MTALGNDNVNHHTHPIPGRLSVSLARVLLAAVSLVALASASATVPQSAPVTVAPVSPAPAAPAPSAHGSSSPVPTGPAAAAAPLTAADLDSWLDGYLPYALKTGDIAGAVVVVVKDGEVLSERGYGCVRQRRVS